MLNDEVVGDTNGERRIMLVTIGVSVAQLRDEVMSSLFETETPSCHIVISYVASNPGQGGRLKSRQSSGEQEQRGTCRGVAVETWVVVPA